MERFRHKVDAFKRAQSLNPSADRQKTSGFLLLVGSGPRIIEAGDDREHAIEKAVEIINEQDTVVFLCKAVFDIGQSKITKDQLIFTRETE